MVPAERTPDSDRFGFVAPEGPLAGVIGLGLDHFREVNAALGVAVADLLLVHAQQRLEALTADLLGDGGRVRRLPGPAFAVLVEAHAPVALYRLAEQLAAALTDPFDTAGGRIGLSCSCGVLDLAGPPGGPAAGGPTDGGPADGGPAGGLDAAIDAAIEAAKQLRRGGVLHYDPVRHGGRSAVLELRAELRDAVSERRLTAAFQPVVSLDHSRVEGAEALARWLHPRLGPIEPLRFLTLIESPALAATLTETMLDAALAQLRSWRDDGVVDDDFYVSVNVPAIELNGPLDHLVLDLLDRHGLTGTNLMLELTEAAAAGETSSRTPQRLRDLGVALAVDDFGTAFASLDRLLTWPVSCLKLDRGLVARVGVDPMANALIAGVGTIAANLDLALVAEGVEAAPQAEILRELSVPSAQGFLWSPPLTGEHATMWLQEYRHLMGPVPPGAPS